jgi:hypothetical protein
MKTKSMVVIACVVSILLEACIGHPATVSIWQSNDDGIPISQIPMYDGRKFTPEQRNANERFINGSIDEFGSLETASEAYVEFDWSYYREGDLATAMKRFNQAWLLDDKNPGAL